MNIIILLILVSVCIAGGFLVAFLWSVRNGQYDDDYAAANRILFDDVPAKRPDPEAQDNPYPDAARHLPNSI